MKLASLSIILGLLHAAPEAHAQCQVEKLVPADTGNGDHFGWSVALSGDWAFVGAYGDDDLVNQSGAVYVHQRQEGSWVQTQKLKASDAEASTAFGYCTAIDGDVAVVTAPFARVGGIQGAGVAYIFERADSSWIETAKIAASDATAAVYFGRSLAVSGNCVLVGTDQEDHAGNQSGAAYLFEKVGSTWFEVKKLVASDGQTGQFFARDLDIEGDLCFIGAPGVSTGQISNHGAAYVFERQGGSWPQTAKLVASDAATFDVFGNSVACMGSVVLASAIGQDAFGANAGAVYVFERQGDQWLETQKLHSSDISSQDTFGADLALSADRAILSASGDDDFGPDSGSAYVFERAGGQWSETGKLLAQDASEGDVLGARVALDGSDALIGMPWEDLACPSDIVCNSGAAYVFTLPQGSAQYGSCLAGGVCANADDHGGCVNSSLRGAVLSACGSSSVTLDDLVLEARFLPPSTFGIVFMGAGETSLPLGDGLRVVAPGGMGLFRFPAAQATQQGVLSLGPGIAASSQAFSAPGAVVPGQRWSFQLWYRDVSGLCGTGTNLSNGVRVDFAP